MKNLLRNASSGWIITVIAVTVAFTSLFHIETIATGFRLSGAVIVLPFLLMTLGIDISAISVCIATGLTTYIFRIIAYVVTVGPSHDMFSLYVANIFFYLVYGILWQIMCPNRHSISYSKLVYILFFCDFISNIAELSLTDMQNSSMDNTIPTLLFIAALRASVTFLLIVIEKEYRTLLQKEEHEKRYQRLFLMTTSLKNEIWFMKKNSEEIERVMATAYKLYEKLSVADNLPPDVKNMSLNLAKDVHEIKKDYIRIITGMEKEISTDDSEKQISFNDLLQILSDTTYLYIENKKLDITLNFICNSDFKTDRHYTIMNILKNLVTNAIEAMEQKNTGDKITIEQAITDSNVVITCTDNGPGISKRHINNIFKMGYSTKFDEKTGNIYRGVGLYGVKSTVEEDFGGTIAVQSEPGNTRFTITIPANSLMDN